MPALRSTRTDKRPARKAPARGARAANDSSEEPELLAAQPLEEDAEEALGEDEDEDEEAETRCICGEIDPPDADGLYIQCEKCSVWQHGFCVSISGNVPEKYWCELCRPELHSITDKAGEKKSKYLPVQPKEPARKPPRRGAGGASAAAKGPSTGTEDESESSSKRNRRERATQDARYEAMIQRVMEESKKDAKQTDVKSEYDDSRGSSSAATGGRSSRNNRRRKHADEDEEGEEGEDDEDIKKERSFSKDADESMLDADTSKVNASFTKPRVSKLKKDSTENDSSESSARNGKAKKQKRMKNVNRSPQKAKDSTIDFNKPTKPRLPQQRTTINEMRRRVAAILEFIGRTQVDIASDQSDKDEMTKYVDDEESKKKIESLFDSYTGSLEQMDVLTRKLLSWEQTFGKYGDK